MSIASLARLKTGRRADRTGGDDTSSPSITKLPAFITLKYRVGQSDTILSLDQVFTDRLTRPFYQQVDWARLKAITGQCRDTMSSCHTASPAERGATDPQTCRPHISSFLSLVKFSIIMCFIKKKHTTISFSNCLTLIYQLGTRAILPM